MSNSRFGCIAVLAAFMTWALPAVAAPPKEITIGVASPSLGSAGARIAKELGLFAKHGIDAKFVIMDSSSAAITGLIAGSFKLAVAGFPEGLVAKSRGQNVAAIATTYSGFSTTYVLSKAVADKIGVSASAPINERLKALDGLVLAAPSATAGGTVAIKNAAQSAGATIRFTYMAQSAMQAALESGAIQGYSSSAPYWAASIARGSAVLWISGPKGDLPEQFVSKITTQLQTMRDYAEANPELVAALKAVFDDMADIAKNRPNDLKAAIGRVYPEVAPDVIELLNAAEARSFGNPRASEQDVRREIDFLKNSGMPLPNVDAVSPASLLIR